MNTAREPSRLSKTKLQSYSILKNKPIRYATQYAGDEEITTSMFNSDYELIRSKEKYKWKCDEIDKEKQQLNSDLLDLKLRTEKLKQAENEIRQMTDQLKHKLKSIKQQEQQLKENSAKLEAKFKEKEQSLQIQSKQLNDKSNELNLKEQQLLILEKSILEKDSLLQNQITNYTQLCEKIKVNLENAQQKEKYYEGQIYKLNQNVENILFHEQRILDLEFQLGKQIQSLKEFENEIRLQIQSCRHQDELLEQKEQSLVKGQELINRKILWDQKNFTKLHNQQVNDYMSLQNQRYY